MTVYTDKNTPNATAAYISAQSTATAQLEAIAEALAQHHDETPAESVNWGHVGDLGYVNAQLAEVLAFLSGYDGMQDR